MFLTERSTRFLHLCSCIKLTKYETEEETEETADYGGGLYARQPQGGPDGRDIRARETSFVQDGAPHK